MQKDLNNTKSFLNLPAEVRLNIYKQLAPLDESPLSQCKALYLSCHQLKDELEDEVVKQLTKCLRSIQVDLSTARPSERLLFTIPTTFSGIRHLKLSVPPIRWQWDAWVGEGIPETWHPLTSLYFDSLTFMVEPNIRVEYENDFESLDQCWWVKSVLMSAIDAVENGYDAHFNARKVILELPSKTMLYIEGRYRDGTVDFSPRGWACSWEYEEGKLVRDIRTRKNS